MVEVYNIVEALQYLIYQLKNFFHRFMFKNNFCEFNIGFQ